MGKVKGAKVRRCIVCDKVIYGDSETLCGKCYRDIVTAEPELKYEAIEAIDQEMLRACGRRIKVTDMTFREGAENTLEVDV